MAICRKHIADFFTGNMTLGTVVENFELPSLSSWDMVILIHSKRCSL